MLRLLGSAAACLLAVLACAAAPASAQTTDPTYGVTGCLVDPGVNAAHQEFAAGQLVGYWDFTDTTSRKNAAFDPKHKPADGYGHGTITAAMMVGQGVSPTETKSFAPGFHFAMADVGTDDGSIAGSIASAVRWCVGTIHADVINISIGSIIPLPGVSRFLSSDDYAALDEAAAAGVLVTVANGNGTANAGLVPSDGAESNYASSLSVLAVGASGTDGATVSYQPEVAAQFCVTGPTKDSTDKYVTESGTSFSSPLTGGFAARLIAEARTAGRTLKAPALEDLVKSASRDTEMPPTFEGYGVIDKDQLAGAPAPAPPRALLARPRPGPRASFRAGRA